MSVYFRTKDVEMAQSTTDDDEDLAPALGGTNWDSPIKGFFNAADRAYITTKWGTFGYATVSGHAEDISLLLQANRRLVTNGTDFWALCTSTLKKRDVFNYWYDHGCPLTGSGGSLS